MNLKPLSNRVIVKPLEAETMTESGIMLPDSGKERPSQGTVVAVGPGKRNEKGEIIPMSVKAGDVVLFKKYGPDEIEMNGEKYLVGDEDDVLAVIEK